MKSLLQRVLLVSTFIVLATGCGKEESGKSKSAVHPLYSNNLTTGNQESLARAQAWYNSTTEGAFTSPAQRTDRRVIKVYSADGGCSNKPIKIFGTTIGTFQSCNNSNSVASQTTVDKLVIPVQNGASKASNAKLAALFNGSLGTISSVTETNGQYGPLYTLQLTNGAGTQITYVIDAGINSVFSPVYIMDSSTRTEESLTQIL